VQFGRRPTGHFHDHGAHHLRYTDDDRADHYGTDAAARRPP
jgi:hypothetical protein